MIVRERQVQSTNGTYDFNSKGDLIAVSDQQEFKNVQEAVALQELLSVEARYLNATPRVHVVRGHKAVLAWEGRLKKLAVQCGQAGGADDLPYHLSTRFASNKIPTLVLLHTDRNQDNPNADGLEAAVLLFEYRILGIRSRLYSSSDVTGRRTVIGPELQRADLAALACRSLMDRGAEIVVLSWQTTCQEQNTQRVFAGVLGSGRTTGIWSLAQRQTPSYLPLRKTLDETFATIGKGTRANLRRYRRKAERDLGCTFVPKVQLGLDEFVRISLTAAFPVEPEIARWRYHSIEKIEDPLFCGVRDADGRWLSLAGGRHSHGHIELDWQTNRPDLPTYSLSTVMRAYLIEHEIGRGSTRLYIDRTHSPLQRSFSNEQIADVTLCRRSLLGWVIRKLVGRLFPERIQLAQVLRDKTIVWRTW